MVSTDIQILRCKVLRHLVDMCVKNLPPHAARTQFAFFYEHGIFPCLFHVEDIEALTGYSDESLQSLKEAFAKQRLRVELLLRNFLQKYSNKKEHFLIVKGIAFECLYYPEGLQRQFTDIDLYCDDINLYPELDPLFDVHVMKDVVQKQTIQLSFDCCNTFGDLENFLLMIAHGTKHQWCRLRWVMDLVWYLLSDKCPTLDVLQDACEKHHLVRAMKVALALSVQIIPSEHNVHDWIRQHVGNAEHRIAKSLLKDIFRYRRQTWYERSINLLRRVVISDTASDAFLYAFQRVKRKVS